MKKIAAALLGTILSLQTASAAAPRAFSAGDTRRVSIFTVTPEETVLTEGKSCKLTVDLAPEYAALADDAVVQFYSAQSRTIVSPDGTVTAYRCGKEYIQVYVTVPDETSDTGYRLETQTVNISVQPDETLPAQIRAEIDRLDGESQYSEFPRRTMELLEILPQPAQRITEEQLTAILQENPDPGEADTLIEAIHGAPDYVWHGDPGDREYWLNDTGSITLVLTGDTMLTRVSLAQDGTVEEVKALYPPDFAASFGTVHPTDGHTSEAYTFYNQIPEKGFVEFQGLALNVPAEPLRAGEVRQIIARIADIYQPDWVIQSKDNDIAIVTLDGHLFAQKAGRTTVYLRAKLDPEKITLEPEDDGVRTLEVPLTVTDADVSALTDAQKAELEALEEKETAAAARIPRKKAVLKGFLDADTPRITLDEVNQIIEESYSFEEIFRKLTDTHPYPDYWGGSGVTSVYYFLDEKGTERIRISLICGSHPFPHDIVYERLNQSGIAEKAYYLYPESRINEIIDIDPNPVLKDWLYCFMNDVPTGILSGDTNNDGKVDATDAVYLQKWLLCEQDMQEINGETTDMNQDGKLNAIDLTLLKQKLLA